MSNLLELTEKTLSDKLAENIVVMDMREVNPFTDYFIICTAKNVRQAQSLAEYVEQEAQKNGYSVRTREGSRESTWVLVDLGDVIVHIMTEEARHTYRLEALWADQPQTIYEA